MSMTLNTYTSNWFKVKYPDELEEYVDLINERVEFLDDNEKLTLHYHNGQLRLTAYDLIDQSLGYYEDEEEEDWVDLEEKIAEMLEENEVFRLTSMSWFKGRLSHFDMSVHTWDGRRESRAIYQWDQEISEKLNIDKKVLGGWN